MHGLVPHKQAGPIVAAAPPSMPIRQPTPARKQPLSWKAHPLPVHHGPPPLSAPTPAASHRQAHPEALAEVTASPSQAHGEMGLAAGPQRAVTSLTSAETASVLSNDAATAISGHSSSDLADSRPGRGRTGGQTCISGSREASASAEAPTHSAFPFPTLASEPYDRPLQPPATSLSAGITHAAAAHPAHRHQTAGLEPNRGLMRPSQAPLYAAPAPPGALPAMTPVSQVQVALQIAQDGTLIAACLPQESSCARNLQPVVAASTPLASQAHFAGIMPRLPLGSSRPPLLDQRAVFVGASEAGAVIPAASRLDADGSLATARITTDAKVSRAMASNRP